jgi:hypothetical protein
VSVGIRHIPIVTVLGAGATRYHDEVLAKYPPKVKVGFAGNSGGLQDRDAAVIYALISSDSGG